MLACWGLLWFFAQLCIENIWVFGDSKVLLDHLNKGTKLHPGHLLNWLEHIYALKKTFATIHFKHIFREKNSQADRLSKKGLIGVFGMMHCELSNLEGEGATRSVMFS